MLWIFVIIAEIDKEAGREAEGSMKATGGETLVIRTDRKDERAFP